MSESNEKPSSVLFWGCFIALITTGFAFVGRLELLGVWGAEFGLDKQQLGILAGIGIWPFAVSIILFSLVIDKIGYGKAMVFAFVCHAASVVLTVQAQGYWDLYWANFIVALGNGTVEAVINPVVATMFRHEKTKRKRGTYRGGVIDTGSGTSFKFAHSDDDE